MEMDGEALYNKQKAFSGTCAIAYLRFVANIIISIFNLKLDMKFRT